MGEKVRDIIRTTTFAILSAVVFIVLGLIFFMVYLWIVNTGASLLGLT